MIVFLTTGLILLASLPTLPPGRLMNELISGVSAPQEDAPLELKPGSTSRVRCVSDWTAAATQSVTKSFRSFDGTRIAYRDVGEGPAVILLHGVSADGRMFGPLEQMRPVLEAINTSIGKLGVQPMIDVPPEGQQGLVARLCEIGRRVIVPDLRGHGASGKPHDPAAYRNSAMARDVLALANHLGLESFDVLGYSLGSIVAAKLLVLPDARVRSAILAGIGKEIIEGEAMVMPASHPAARLPKPITMSAYNNFVAAALTGANNAPSNPYRVFAKAYGNDLEALAAALRGTGAEMVPAAALHRMEMPVLLLNGRNDPAHQATGRLLEVLSNGKAIICDGDHLSAPWQPSCQQAAVEFLTRRWRQRGP
jgi:pimeloyl-ACP methyl ester carboxylesterase